MPYLRFSKVQLEDIENAVTGTRIPQADIIPRANLYISRQLAEATFQQFVAFFENFVFDFLRLWLFTYPRSLSARKVDFQVIVDAPDRETILREIIDIELNERAYKRPADWFAFLDSRVHLGCPTEAEIEQFAEAKATRDILAHNRGIANRIYSTKAGSRARHPDGERIEIPEPYHRLVWNLCRKLVTAMTGAGVARSA